LGGQSSHPRLLLTTPSSTNAQPTAQVLPERLFAVSKSSPANLIFHLFQYFFVHCCLIPQSKKRARFASPGILQLHQQNKNLVPLVPNEPGCSVIAQKTRFFYKILSGVYRMLTPSHTKSHRGLKTCLSPPADFGVFLT
jgi:hypothetical protein